MSRSKLTTAQLKLLRDRASVEGFRIARKVFAKRGNHTEAHLSEGELAAMLVVAFELGYSEGVPQPVLCTACASLSAPPEAPEIQ